MRPSRSCPGDDPVGFWILGSGLPFPRREGPPIIVLMERPASQMTVAAMLGVVACIAVNFWLLRLGVFWGILGLNVTKHVVTAYLCQVLGVDRRPPSETAMIVSQRAPQVPVP